jgi:hypothetical protein
MITSWPLSEPVLARGIVVLLIMSAPNGLRTLCFRRSDETWADRLLLVLIRPLSAIWSGVVLARVIRIWGTLTLLKQGWTTRQNGAELVLTPDPASAGAMAAAGTVTSARAAA